MFEKLETHCDISLSHFSVRWQAENVGFGGFYFYRDENDVWHCDNECMSKEFIKKMLSTFVDSCQLKS